MSVDQGPSYQDQAGGGFPFERLLNLFGDPSDPNRITWSERRRMRRDHMISMGLHYIVVSHIKASWYYECENAQIATFADKLVRQVYGRLILMIMRFLWSGYSPGVKAFDTVNPDWVYLDGNGEVKKVWTSQNVGALVYKDIIPLKPELCMPEYDGSGGFSGIKYDPRWGDGSFMIYGQQVKEIDLLHSVWAIHNQEEEDNSPWGYPRIGPVAPIYRMYWYIWAVIGRSMENHADPGPVMRYPEDDPDTLDADGNIKKNVSRALDLGSRRRGGSTIALPSTPYTDFTDRPSATTQKWGIEYPKVDTNFADIQAWLGFLEAAKLRGIWISEQGLTEGGGSQSNRNVAQEFGNLRDESQIVLSLYIDKLIDEVLVKPAIAMNFPWFEGSIRKKTIGYGQADEDAVRQFFQLIGQKDWQSFGIDARRLAESRGFPMLDVAAQAEILKEAAKAAEAAPTPAVTPTDGRRALVTQTGFGETIYVQLGDQMEFAEDGDFASSLPSTDHFSDRAVVATARELRGYSRSFLSDLYSDFAKYLSLQPANALKLSDEGEDLVDPRKAINKIIKMWMPDPVRASAYGQRVRTTLSKVFSRASALNSKRLLVSDPVTARDEDAASWLDDHAAELVTSVNDTVRQELSDFLAKEVRAGTSVDDLASKIKSEFSQWPTWKADMIARTETAGAYNYATLRAGKSAGIKQVQIIDGTDDQPCRERNGKIVSIDDAFEEQLAHPRCTVAFRLLSTATSLSIVRAPVEDDLLARFDKDSNTILLSPHISGEDERKYLLTLGEGLAA